MAEYETRNLDDKGSTPFANLGGDDMSIKDTWKLIAVLAVLTVIIWVPLILTGRVVLW